MSKKHSLEQIINISREIFKTSSLTDAFIEISGNKLVVNSNWSQADIEKNERTKFQKSFFFEIDESKPQIGCNLVYLSNPQSIRNEIWNVKSPNNKKTAIVTNWKENGEDKQFIEIWNDQTRQESLNLTKLDKHSKIYENSELLGSFRWSSDSKKIAYIAEAKKLAKEKCFFTSKIEKSNQSSNDPNGANKDELLNEKNFESKYANSYVDDWGEQYVGKSQSIISIFDTETSELKVLDNLPKDYCPGQLAWQNNEGIVFSAFYTKPYRLGLVYCPVRKSELFYYDISTETCTQITNEDNQCVHDPNFSNDFEYVCWLQNQARGPHFQCTKLMLMKWKTKEINCITDIVREYTDQDETFPGLFAIKFSKNCWSLDNKRILVNTQWKRANRIVVVDIETKSITPLDNNIDKLNSCHSIHIKNDWICAILQGYNRKPSLIIGKLPEKGNEKNINWILTEKNDSLMNTADVELIKMTPKILDSVYPNVNFESILIQPKSRNDTLIVFPHGGPHSCYCCEYSPHVTIFFSLGYSILLINYRGSSGYGQDSIDSLPGKVGTSDVNDVQEAAEFTMKKYNFKNAVVYGGSHGGFLGTHLIGQFPDFYKAASVRNAVTHLESELFLSDIPDWVICEGTGSYDFDYKITGSPEIYSELYKRSPIRYVDNVKTPTLLMIGMIDLRVPPQQGLEYYKALISRNVEAKAFIYKEDNHPLDKPQTTTDCIVSTILWYEKFLN